MQRKRGVAQLRPGISLSLRVSQNFDRWATGPDEAALAEAARAEAEAASAEAERRRKEEEDDEEAAWRSMLGSGGSGYGGAADEALLDPHRVVARAIGFREGRRADRRRRR